MTIDNQTGLVLEGGGMQQRIYLWGTGLSDGP